MAKENGKAPTSVLSDILLLLLKILIVILLFVLLFTFLFGATRYNDVAMEPNIKSGDLVIYSRIDKDFRPMASPSTARSRKNPTPRKRRFPTPRVSRFPSP